MVASGQLAVLTPPLTSSNITQSQDLRILLELISTSHSQTSLRCFPGKTDPQALGGFPSLPKMRWRPKLAFGWFEFWMTDSPRSCSRFFPQEKPRHQLGCAEDRAATEAGQGDRPPGQPHDGEDAQHLPKLHCAVRCGSGV
uniref:Retinol binding protein 5 n=1 Tax=Macaca mulatta TaxID=9544 RepID=A0A5F7ZS55_MACMU